MLVTAVPGGPLKASADEAGVISRPHQQRRDRDEVDSLGHANAD